MVKLEKDGVIMVVSEDMATLFKKEGYMETKNHDEVEKEKEDQKQYSRPEIMRMSTADLKETATSIGIEVTEESTGKALKEEILAKLGL